MTSRIQSLTYSIKNNEKKAKMPKMAQEKMEPKCHQKGPKGINRYFVDLVGNNCAKTVCHMPYLFHIHQCIQQANLYEYIFGPHLTQ